MCTSRISSCLKSSFLSPSLPPFISYRTRGARGSGEVSHTATCFVAWLSDALVSKHSAPSVCINKLNRNCCHLECRQSLIRLPLSTRFCICNSFEMGALFILEIRREIRQMGWPAPFFITHGVWARFTPLLLAQFGTPISSRELH